MAVIRFASLGYLSSWSLVKAFYSALSFYLFEEKLFQEA